MKPGQTEIKEMSVCEGETWMKKNKIINKNQQRKEKKHRI